MFIAHQAIGDARTIQYCLLKSAYQEEIEGAILAVNANKLYMSPNLALNEKEPDEISKSPVLASREKDVVSLIAEGLTNPQIVEKLFISTYTVDSHCKNLLVKFSVNNTAGLIKLAAKYGFVWGGDEISSFV